MEDSKGGEGGKSPLFQQEGKVDDVVGVEPPLSLTPPPTGRGEDGKGRGPYDDDEHEHGGGGGRGGGRSSGRSSGRTLTSPTVVEDMDNTMFHTYPVTPVDGKEGGGLRKRRTRRGSDGVSRASKGRAATIIRASDVLDNTKQTPFFRWTIAWILLVSLIGSCFLMHFEGGKGGEDGGLGWVDAIFLSAGGVTATGLNR